jgi:predicted GNAT family acetyltransferase
MMAVDELDRPVWNALRSRQAGLAIGEARAWRFAPEYGVFAAAADGSAASQAALAALLPAGGEIWLVETAAVPPPPGFVLRSASLCHQMVARAVTPDTADVAFVDLEESDAPEMHALATLTVPGPFFARTHRLGQFVGVRQGGRLVAMAGERMKPPGATEVSGVCTHPAHRGRGYAGALMREVTRRILARGELAFLHVYASNTGAIALYEALGFALRREMTMMVLERA